MKIQLHVFLLLSFLISPLLVCSQKIIDIKADLIQLEENNLGLYQKSNSGRYRSIYFELNQLYDYEYHVSLYSDLIDSSELITSAKSIQSLPNFTLKNLHEEDISLYNMEGDYIFQLNLFNDAFFTVRTFQHKQTTNDITEPIWIMTETEYYNFFILKIDKDKQIFVLVENDGRYSDVAGLFAKSSSGYVGFVDGMRFSAAPQNKTEIKQLQKLNKGYNYKEPFNELYRIDENNQLRDLVFDQKLLEKEYDTVYIKNNFIIGSINKTYDIYNLRLNSIAPNDTRSVHTSQGPECQILVNNHVKWLNKSGNISDQKEQLSYLICGTVTTVSREIEQISKQFRLIEVTDHFDGQEPPKVIHILGNANYDDMWFLNSTKKLKYDGNSGLNAIYDLPGNEYNFLIVEKNNKYGLLEFRVENDNVLIDEIISTTYDSIIFESYYKPILLQKGNLYGYYPINKELKYKSISKFDGSFARFTLPNGQKGWLDINGKEYLDE